MDRWPKVIYHNSSLCDPHGSHRRTDLNISEVSQTFIWCVFPPYLLYSQRTLTEGESMQHIKGRQYISQRYPVSEETKTTWQLENTQRFSYISLSCHITDVCISKYLSPFSYLHSRLKNEEKRILNVHLPWCFRSPFFSFE